MFYVALHDAVLGVAAVTLCVAAFTDIKKLIISNRLCIFLTLLFPLYVLTAPHPMMWVQHVWVALAVFMICFAMFALNLIGGGDAKMLSAVALWAGPVMIVKFLFFTSIAGGLLALGFACVAIARKHAWRKAPIPYGVAIACGAIVSFINIGGL